jgi:prepilin-type N-terminal cleavage/methylation domain-containing protein
MSTAHMRRPRAGVTLVELLVAMTLLGIIGLSIVRTFTSQARFADLQSKRLDSRAVSRAPINLLMSEARMVETGSGVVAASTSSITLRVPVAMGIVCGTAGASTVMSLMPVDSATLASAAISGTAYRQTSGVYTYAEGVTTVTPYTGNVCTAGALVTKVSGGSEVLVTPQLAAAVGTPAFVYQRVRYDFANSSSFTGRIGLWRTLEASGASEEVAAPFDATAQFRFFRNNSDTTDTAIPPLALIRGFQLSLVGASERARFGRVTPETSRMQTSVFFMNRID